MRKISNIIIHHSASSFGCAQIIRNWHVQGNGWKDIGYHFVIGNGRMHGDHYVSSFDGMVEPGRPLTQQGAHVKGYNKESIGICMVGNGKFTNEQFFSLLNLVDEMSNMFNIPVDKIFNHSDFSNKACPGFNVRDITNIIFSDYYVRLK